MTNTTGVMRAPAARRFRTKSLVFTAIAAMAAYVLYHNERFLLDPAHPIWNHYEPFKWWLLPHGLAGACALLLAPLQFAEGLRQRHTACIGQSGQFTSSGYSFSDRSGSTSNISTKRRERRALLLSRP